jgi:dihydroorotate dehydrogenase (NAD+) catalytic subunit
MTPDLGVDLFGLRLRNPVVTASGTAGYGRELARFFDLSILGAFTAKSVSLQKRPGNPVPRIAESASGLLNSIGIPSQGVHRFIEEDLPFLRQCDVPVFVSISAGRADDFGALAEILDGEEGISAIEANISCPNLEAGGCSFGSDPEAAGRIVRLVKVKTRRPVIAKLPPFGTDVSRVALAAEENGADAIALINTLPAMAIDIGTWRPKLGNVTGGLSGPAIKPVAVKLVWDVTRAVSVPVIGMGGIATWEDAIEFVLAGATAVAVGTALMRDPFVVTKVIDGMTAYLESRRIHSLAEIRGAVRI